MNLINSFRLSVRHLYNKRKIFFMSSIIMLISIIMVFQVCCIYLACRYEINRIHNLFGSDIKKLYKIEQGYISSDIEYYQKFNDCIIKLRDEYDIAIYENTNILPTGVYGEEFADFMMKNFTSEELERTGGLPPFLKIDDSLISLIGLKDENNNDIHLGAIEGKLEVAIGSIYKNILPVGTEFYNRYTGQEYIVKYILKDGQSWIDGSIYKGGRIESLNKCLIAAPDMEYYADGLSSVYENNIYFLADASEIESVKDGIQCIADDNGVFINIMSFNEYEADYMKEHNNLYLFSFILVIILACSALVTVTVLSLVSWLLDYHDLGIFYANGLLSIDIFKIILIENMIRLLIPVFVAYAVVSMSDIWMNLALGYVNTIFIFISILFMIAIVLVSCITYKIIDRQTPSVLLKGEGL